jgi:hypothetical protein
LIFLDPDMGWPVNEAFASTARSKVRYCAVIEFREQLRCPADPGFEKTAPPIQAITPEAQVPHLFGRFVMAAWFKLG